MRIGILVLVAGCGRLGFGELTHDANAPGDVRRVDAPDAAPGCGLFCDDFEAATFDPRWQIDAFGGTVSLDGTHVHGGAAALHVHTDAVASSSTDRRATLLTYAALPVTGTIYSRVWVYFTSPQPGVVFDQIIDLADDPGKGMSTGSRAGQLANNDYTAQNYAMSTTTLPLDTWACLMYEMPSGTTGTSRVYLDGTELTDVALPKTSSQPPPTHIYLGLEWVGTVTSQPAADAWLDDVIVDTVNPGC